MICYTPDSLCFLTRQKHLHLLRIYNYFLFIIINILSKKKYRCIFTCNNIKDVDYIFISCTKIYIHFNYKRYKY